MSFFGSDSPAIQASWDSADEWCLAECPDDYCRGAWTTDCLLNQSDLWEPRESLDELHRDVPALPLHRPDVCVLRVVARQDGKHLAFDCPAAGRVADGRSWDDPYLESESGEYSLGSRNERDPRECRD